MEQRFKTGDRVRLIADGLSTVGAVGMLGTVRFIAPGIEHPYQIELDEGGKYESHAVTDAYRWTWAAERALEPAHPFKVGDRVHAPEYGHWWSDMTVEQVKPGLTFPVLCRNADGFGGGFKPEDLELIEERVPAFKIGDRVQAFSFKSDENPGTIVRARNGEFDIVWDDDPTWSSDELYHLPATPTLKPGIRVRITGGAAAGEEGVVLNLNGGVANIRTDDLYTDRAGQLMRHVSVGKSNVIPLAA
ncbi:MAG: hypothetical protein K0S56_565 [Microvirga sp.]|jgi:hypothetical protein|nr:hypothetical protein [Microvirga sp.]